MCGRGGLASGLVALRMGHNHHKCKKKVAMGSDGQWTRVVEGLEQGQ